MTRKTVRDALLGAKVEFKKEVVKYNGVEVEIRQPSYEARKEVMDRAKEDGGINPLLFLVWAVIENTYLKGTDEKIFEDTDYDALVSRPVGGFMDKFGEVAATLMNVNEDIAEKAKN